jgi:hypothetical protein
MRPMPDVPRKGKPREPGLGTVSEACAALLASLPRVDQRRKGESYVRGLLTAPGRKTMRNLATSTVARPSSSPIPPAAAAALATSAAVAYRLGPPTRRTA